MQADEQLLKKRLSELSSRSYANACYTNTEFLTVAEQQTLFELRLDSPFTLCGGFENAERCIAVFGNEEICGYAASPPIICINIKPLSQKFADALSHRDCLGSLMALGVRREVLGDIILHENEGYLFCLESVASFIIENLTKVKHTSVKCEVCSVEKSIVSPEPEASEFVVASLRIDAVISAVFNLSRGDSQKLFEQKKVFIGGRICESVSHFLSDGALVSVRGFGRFRFDGVKLETKKGKLRISVGVF